MIKQERTFTVAGTATGPDGVTKVRWANDLVSRIKILNKTGCTDINLFELPCAMTKLQCLDWLRNQGLEGSAGYAVELKYAEKVRAHKRRMVSVTQVAMSSIRDRMVQTEHN